MSFPTRTLVNLEGIKRYPLAIVNDPSDSNPISISFDASGLIGGYSINVNALFDANGKLVAGDLANANFTSATANALTVGPNGTTNPSFNVDASTASSATGINIKSAAAAAGVAVSVLSSGAAENLTLDAKGTGTISIGTVSTGAITLGAATGVTGALTITSAGASALTVGRLGATTPALKVDASAGTSVTGLNLAANAAGSGYAVSVVGGNAAESLSLDSKGAGAINLGGVSTGQVIIGRGAVKPFIFSSTKTAGAASQNTTPTAAQLLGGVFEHLSQTGGGTCTLDTAANIDSAITSATNGDTFDCVIANTGTQTVTITTNTGLTLKGTVAIPTLKNAFVSFFRTGAGAWTVYSFVG